MSTGGTHILPDANVLFSRTLRDWILLIHLESAQPMYHVHWTEDIMAEVIANLRQARPMAPDQQIGGVRRRIIEACGEDRVICGYAIDQTRNFRDPKDAHVYAAATAGSVDIVVTDNEKDITATDDDQFEVLSADSFLVLVDDSNPDAVRQVVLRQYQYWVKREGHRSLPDQLRACAAPMFASRVEWHLRAIGLPHETL